MPQFLTFTLVAPIASFGAIAVGERRPGWDRPARSAVLGLIGACLGVEREEDAAQAALDADYHLAILCHAPGRMLADYHTAQVPSAERGMRHATRAAELARPSHALNTILTRRDYRTGAWHLGAIWPRGAAPRWSLETLAAAMERPVFTPCLGRKSCPLGLPLGPEVTEAPDALAALEQRNACGRESAWRDLFAPRGDTVGTTIAMDGDALAEDDPRRAKALRIEHRRDAPRSRRRWQFDLREELILSVAAS